MPARRADRAGAADTGRSHAADAPPPSESQPAAARRGRTRAPTSPAAATTTAPDRAPTHERERPPKRRKIYEKALMVTQRSKRSWLGYRDPTARAPSAVDHPRAGDVARLRRRDDRPGPMHKLRGDRHEALNWYK
jgi:hypothetical protein